MIKKHLTIYATIIFGIISFNTQSQEVIDQIIAVVGSEPVLKSEIENQYLQMQSQSYSNGAVDLKCEIFEEMLFQKLLLNQAVFDSIETSPKEIDTELNRRLSVFINQIGSEEKLEEFYGKSIVEIKEEFRDIIEDQLLAQKMQAEITKNAKITPKEVKNYYNSLSTEEIPIIEANYELSQIVKNPIIIDAEINEIKAQLEDMRKRVTNGEKFSTLAILYSQDPGSSSKGGELGFVSRTDVVAEFAAVAFNLNSTEEVSQIVKTEFGYHILQLIEKKGEMVNLRHILLTPKPDPYATDSLINLLKDVKRLIELDSITFEEAVEIYSDDEDTKNNDGKLMNPYTGNSNFTEQSLDPTTKYTISSLKEGELSKPAMLDDMRGKPQIKILHIDKKEKEHIANLQEDYQEIYEFALMIEQERIIANWVKEKLEKTYIRIDQSYSNCTYKYADWDKY